MLDQISTAQDFLPVTEGGAVSLRPQNSFGHPHFRCLGVDGTTFFFQPSEVAGIVQLSAKDLKGASMLRLAPLQWWEVEFPGKSKEGGVNWMAAANACIQTCLKIGMFREERVTGRGVYIEPGSMRVVAHLGDHLVVDGEEAPLDEHASRRIYVETTPSDLPSLPPLATGEATKVAELAERFLWDSPEAGKLFAGWLVVAPLSGVLPWRPHVWINGPSGSGKSTVMEKFLEPLLSGLAVKIQGAATEAGLRQMLGRDALPVIFDEAEAKTEKAAARVQAILELARSAATESGAQISKGGSGGRGTRYVVKSAFAFASVDVALGETSDENRVVRLGLRKADEDAASVASFLALKSDLLDLLSRGYGPRLFYRTLRLTHTILGNAQAFKEAIASRPGGDGRDGDVYGHLLAGWYSLKSEERISVKQAAAMIDKWRWLTASMERDHVIADHDKALAHLMAHQLHLDHGRRRAVGELVNAVVYGHTDSEEGKANTDLIRNGLRVSSEDGRWTLSICRHAASVKSIFAGTQWSVDPWKTIERADFAKVSKHPTRFGAAGKQRAVEVDLRAAGYLNSGTNYEDIE